MSLLPMPARKRSFLILAVHGERVKKGHQPDHSAAPRAAAVHVIPQRPMRHYGGNIYGPREQPIHCRICGKPGHKSWECR